MEKPSKPTAKEVKHLYNLEYGSIDECISHLMSIYKVEHAQWMLHEVNEAKTVDDLKIVLFEIIERLN